MIMKAIEEKALYINQLCRRLGLGRRIITFHLIDLEKLKLIETYWNPLPSSQHKKQMTLARFVKLTPKGKTVLKDVDGYLDTLKPTHHA
jgi:DNA-binding transcriptional ArsR family regulator